MTEYTVEVWLQTVEVVLKKSGSNEQRDEAA